MESYFIWVLCTVTLAGGGDTWTTPKGDLWSVTSRRDGSIGIESETNGLRVFAAGRWVELQCDRDTRPDRAKEGE